MVAHLLITTRRERGKRQRDNDFKRRRGEGREWGGNREWKKVIMYSPCILDKMPFFS